MSSQYKKMINNWPMRVLLFLISIFIIWWVLNLKYPNSSFLHFELWAYLYQIIALVGGVSGLLIARKWGGFKSAMGRVTIIFSIGLLCQNIAQTVGSYLYWKIGTVPYPSLSDVGAFGALIFYAIGAIYLAKISGASISLRNLRGRTIALVVPLVFLGASFYIFLSSYQYDWSQPLTTFLDIGYPLGEAFYVSMAILAYLLSRNYLGGIMRVPIRFFIAALIAEYVADFLFLYNSHAGTYVGGGLNDFLFVISYSLMAISLIQLGVVFKEIKNS